MIVEIWLDTTSMPIIYTEVTSTYQKGDLFCIYSKERNIVVKYPIANIFRVVENYQPFAIPEVR
ncbi:MAG: hypothetical protein ABSE06_01440 [Anaerolineaceae bacterium]